MKVKKAELICVVCMLCGILISIIGFLFDDLMIQNICILLLFAANISYGLADFYNRTFFLAFQVTFFTFLLGRTISYMLTGKENTYGFTEQILTHTNICLMIALISLLIGYILADYIKSNSVHGRKKRMDFDEGIYDSMKYQSIRTVSKWCFFATFPFDVLIGVEKYIFVRAMGYAEYYVSYSSNFPYVIVKIADVCIIAFYIFLATFPSKKEIKVPIILYLIHAVVSLGSGKRQEFIVPLILLILYFCVRNKIRNGGEPWIKGKHFRILVIVLPFLLAAMYTYNVSRFSGSNSQSVNQTSLVEEIGGFFENTGFSVNVISFEKYYEDRIPDKCYSFGDTIEYLRENVLTQLFFDFPVYKTQTVDKALHGYNFSQTITYIRSATYYLSGRGYGSCYIAEAYHDFGYIGIIFWSMLYSFVLVYMYDFRGRGIMYVTISLSALHYILIAPRNMASAFISEMINVNTWLTIFVILFASKLLLSKYKGKVMKSNARSVR